MVSLELEARADLAGAVGRVLRSDRVRGRSRSGGAEHRKVDGGEDLLEGEHGSRVKRSCEGVRERCKRAREQRGETETCESLSGAKTVCEVAWRTRGDGSPTYIFTVSRLWAASSIVPCAEGRARQRDRMVANRVCCERPYHFRQ